MIALPLYTETPALIATFTFYLTHYIRVQTDRYIVIGANFNCQVFHPSADIIRIIC